MEEAGPQVGFVTENHSARKEEEQPGLARRVGLSLLGAWPVRTLAAWTRQSLEDPDSCPSLNQAPLRDWVP